MKESDARVEKSRKALISAALQVFTRNPDAALSEVAIVAGVGRATLYRHFKIREQLLVELASEALIETDRACAHILQQKLKGKSAIEAMFIAVIPLADQFHFLLSLWGEVEGNAEIKAHYSRQLAQLEKHIEEAKKEKSIDAALPNEWLIALIDNLLYTGWYCVGNQSLTVEQASNMAVRTFFYGVGKKG